MLLQPVHARSQDCATRRQESTNDTGTSAFNLGSCRSPFRWLPRDSPGGLNMSKQIPVSHMAFVRARPGRSQELGVRLSALIEPSRAAPGCLSFALQQSQCDPQLWLVSGFWVNQQAMNAYFSTPAMEVFAELVQELVVDSLDFHTFKDVSATQALRQSGAAVHKLAG